MAPRICLPTKPREPSTTTPSRNWFWGLRGGGGNFGIATAFEYQLHPAGPIVLAGPIFWPLDQAPEVLRVVHEFMADPPDEVGVVSVLRLAPPMPFLPAEQYGKPVIGVVPVYVGDPAAGAKALEPLRSVGTPIADVVRPVPYLFLQTMFDGGLPPGLHYHLKSNLLRDLSAEVIDLLVAHARSVTSPLSAIRLHWLNGEARRIDPESTATTGRDAAVDINFTSAWSPLVPEAEPHVEVGP